MGQVYDRAYMYVKKHRGGVVWNLRKHCEVIEKHLNPGEEVLYAFAGQKNDNFYDFFTTCVVALTNKRILIGQRRVFWGYFLSSVTPDLYNDLFVYQGLIWGTVKIDTVKEEITISNLSKDGLDEIETNITEMMMTEKKKYGRSEDRK